MKTRITKSLHESKQKYETRMLQAVTLGSRSFGYSSEASDSEKE